MTDVLQRSTAPPLLQVRDVRTSFETSRGLLQAVDGVSFDLAAGETLGIPVLDHVVIGRDGFVSFRETGRL